MAAPDSRTAPHQVGRREAEQNFRVADAEHSLGDPRAKFLGQREQAHRIGDGRAVLADFRGDVFLREMKLGSELFVGKCFFDGIQVFALQVFD